MPSIDNLELLEERVSKLESLVGNFEKLDQTKVLKYKLNTTSLNKLVKLIF
jgi:hypothetical protein